MRFEITTDPSDALGAFSIEDGVFQWTTDYESSFYALRAQQSSDTYRLDVRVTLFAVAGIEPFTISDG